MKYIMAIMLLIYAPSTAKAQNSNFNFTFEWGNIPLCTSGKPNTVHNPHFELFNLPAGTVKIYFKLIDEDVPHYKHGGGIVYLNNSSKIDHKAFTYESPCPPNGQHRYSWHAYAMDTTGTVLAKTKQSKHYPE